MTRDSTATPAADRLPEPALADEGTPVPPVGEPPSPEEGGELEPIAREAEIDPAKLDPDALKVVRRLHHHGHQAYFVGGCVRDLLLCKKPKDFDIATSAHPGEVRALFRNCRLIGRRFRLAHVYFKGGKIIEVSTFRANPTEVEEAEGELEQALDAASDEEVARAEPANDLLITQDNVFGTAEQDARRRDFTINGLFYDVFLGKVIDYVEGREDLAKTAIRTIGDPEIRMREDPVRILRAVRFACKLGFDIESATYAAMEGAVEDLPRCAPPRLLEETFRLLRAGIATESLKLLGALDALKILLPPVGEFLAGDAAQSERFFRHTDVLDRKILADGPAEDAVLLSAVLLPIALSAPVPEEGTSTVSKALEELLADLVRNARLPRRIAERCRLLLSAQRTLSGKARRRRSLASFRRHPLFSQALAVFEMGTQATGEGGAALEKWKAGSWPEPSQGFEPAPRGRRRRRRRKPRQPGGVA